MRKPSSVVMQAMNEVDHQFRMLEYRNKLEKLKRDELIEIVMLQFEQNIRMRVATNEIRKTLDELEKRLAKQVAK